jgi:hypothetical protein
MGKPDDYNQISLVEDEFDISDTEDILEAEIRAIGFENALLDLRKKLSQQRAFVQQWEDEFANEAKTASENRQLQQAKQEIVELQRRVEQIQEDLAVLS